MRWALLIALSGCANVRPAVPGPRATTTVQEFRRPDRPTFWVATVNNPSPDRVYIDCDEARIPIEAGTQVDVYLDADDNRCDLKNDVEYASLPGRMSKSWGVRLGRRVSP